MLIYADSSLLFAHFYVEDSFSEAVDTVVKKLSPDFVYWPFLRFELRHNLRWMRTGYAGAAAWRALMAAESTAARLRWQMSLRVDSLIEAADDLSGEENGKIECGAADFIHVAAAKRLKNTIGIDGFWTCDLKQADLARKCGLEVREFAA